MEQINSELQGDKLWLRKSDTKPVEESQKESLNSKIKNSVKRQAPICSTLLGTGNKKSLLNTQQQKT